MAKRLDFDSPGTMERPSKWRRLGAFQVIGGSEPTGNNEPQRRAEYVNLTFGRPPVRSKLDKLAVDRLRYIYTTFGKGAGVVGTCAFGKERSYTLPGPAGNVNLTTRASVPFLNWNNYTTGLHTKAPIFIYSLTGAPQSSGSASSALAFTGTAVVNNGGDVSFSAPGTGQNDPTVHGITQSGAVTNEWSYYDVGQTGADNLAVGPRAMLENTEIVLHLWGCSTQPTTFKVMLCQFEEDCVPLYDVSTGATSAASGTTYSANSNAALWWKNWVKKLTYNPDHKGTKSDDVGMKVLYQRYINIEPTQTTDNDLAPQHHRLRLNVDWYRSCRFDWSNVGQTATEDYVNAPGFTRQAGNVSADVEPKARVYLVVTATNYDLQTTTTAGTISNTTVPCMDFSILSRWART